MEIWSYIFSVFLLIFCSQNDRLIKCAAKGDLSGVEVALPSGADVNATDSVS